MFDYMNMCSTDSYRIVYKSFLKSLSGQPFMIELESVRKLEII
jgi:hypothetical protein